MTDTPPGWHPDPTGRHEHRFWDGASWTDQVSDGGTVAADPLDGGSSGGAAAPAGAGSGAGGSGGADDRPAADATVIGAAGLPGKPGGSPPPGPSVPSSPGAPPGAPAPPPGAPGAAGGGAAPGFGGLPPGAPAPGSSPLPPGASGPPPGSPPVPGSNAPPPPKSSSKAPFVVVGLLVLVAVVVAGFLVLRGSGGGVASVSTGTSTISAKQGQVAVRKIDLKAGEALYVKVKGSNLRAALGIDGSDYQKFIKGGFIDTGSSDFGTDLDGRPFFSGNPDLESSVSSFDTASPVFKYPGFDKKVVLLKSFYSSGYFKGASDRLVAPITGTYYIAVRSTSGDQQVELTVRTKENPKVSSDLDTGSYSDLDSGFYSSFFSGASS